MVLPLSRAFCTRRRGKAARARCKAAGLLAQFEPQLVSPASECRKPNLRHPLATPAAGRARRRARVIRRERLRGADLPVVWFERLSLAIGSSALSLGVVLATFMAGLGIGSLLASRGSRRSPLATYAVIELAIGILGLVTLAAMPLLGGAYAALAGGGAMTLWLRLILAALALLPATILMGATLPVIAAHVRADARAAAWLGGVTPPTPSAVSPAALSPASICCACTMLTSRPPPPSR